MQDHFNIVRDDRTRKVVIAMLCGDIDMIEKMLRSNNNQPLPIDETDSYELAFALYDAFRFDKEKRRVYTQRVEEILQLHQAICPHKERSYTECPYINPPMTPFYEEKEFRILREDNIATIDIALMDRSLEFDEAAVIELLKQGACPYYLDRSDLMIEDGEPEYRYNNIAPAIDWLGEEIFFRWQEGEYDNIKAPEMETNEKLSSAVEDIFNVAANNRMLYIIDSNITQEAKEKGLQLMTQYLGQIFPIMDYEP